MGSLLNTRQPATTNQWSTEQLRFLRHYLYRQILQVLVLYESNAHLFHENS